MELFKELQNQMHNYRFRPDRRIGQNFIIGESVIEKMVAAAELKQNDVVLEVGPGTGFLTQELLKHCRVVAVELDDVLFELLKEKFKEEIESKKLTLIHGNILSMKLPKFNKVVSLPPYHISSLLMGMLLLHDFKLAVLVLQREFSQKILSEPGFADYHHLSVEIDYGFKSEIILNSIPPSNFFPKPNTFSSIIKLTRKKPLLEVKDYLKFRDFLHQVFRLKNKNLSNAAQMTFPFSGKFRLDKEKFVKKLAKIDLKDVKVNLISSKEFAEIFNKLF
jgi:16S rRNA (adenine1518-N6/adenine1519-N6)-dimethyltransferase